MEDIVAQMRRSNQREAFRQRIAELKLLVQLDPDNKEKYIQELKGQTTDLLAFLEDHRTTVTEVVSSVPVEDHSTTVTKVVSSVPVTSNNTIKKVAIENGAIQVER